MYIGLKLTHHNTLTMTPIAAGKNRSSLPMRHRRLKAINAGIFLKLVQQTPLQQNLLNKLRFINLHDPTNYESVHITCIKHKILGKKFITTKFCPINHFNVDQKSALPADIVNELLLIAVAILKDEWRLEHNID